MRSIVICDIDGTLADTSKRLHYLKQTPPNWDAFHEACDGDAPIDATCAVVGGLVQLKGYLPIFVTGRPERVRTKTLHWLRAHLDGLNSTPDLHMRPDADHSEDYELKREIWKKRIAPMAESVRLVLEDRGQCVKMWRELGLTCWQVAEGAY